MNRSIKKIFSAGMVRAVFLFVMGCAVAFAAYSLVESSQAAVDTVVTDATGGSLFLKQGSNPKAALSIAVGSNDDGKLMQNVVVVFSVATGTPAWDDGLATSSELLDLAATNGGVSLWKESGAHAGFQEGEDTQIELGAPLQYGGGGTSFTMTPAAPVALAENDLYYVAVRSDASGVTDGNRFVVTIPTNGIVTDTGPSAAAQVSTAPISMDTVAPVVGSGGPNDGEQGVPVEALVDRGFGEQLDQSSVTTSTVLLQANDGNTEEGTPGGSNLCVNAVYDNGSNRIICGHMADSAPLNAATWYTFTITTGVTDRAGNPLAAPASYSFRTSDFAGGSGFNPPPFIMGTVPMPGTQLPTNGKIVLYFSKPMATSGDGSIMNVNVVKLFATQNFQQTGSNLLTSTTGWAWSADSNRLSIPLPGTVAAGSSYKVIVVGDDSGGPNDGSCGGSGEPVCAMSSDGLALPMPQFMVDFTAAAADSTGPSVLGSYPAPNATGIDRAIYDISASFNEAIDPASVGGDTVRLFADEGDGSFDAGTDTLITTGTFTVDYDGRTIMYSPNALLAAGTKHFFVLGNDGSSLTDLVGNEMSAVSTRAFTTGSNVNGAGTDSTNPTITVANADNFGIAITFSEPMQVDTTANATRISSTNAHAVNNANLWTIETSNDGSTWAQVPLTDPTTDELMSGKSIRYEGHTNTLFIDGLAMPPEGQFRVTASTAIYDLAGNGMGSARTAQGTVRSSTDTGGMLGMGGNTASGPDFFEMGMKPVKAFPHTALAGATSRYEIEFPADAAIPASGKIVLTYPSGFSFASACDTWLTDNFENGDINGPATGSVTVASIACDNVSRAVTVTLGAATGIQQGDMVRFTIQGVVNTTVPKDFSTSGYSVDLKTYNASNTLLETKTTMPFFITTPGTRSVSGKVFVDDGDGGGTANNGTPDGTEAGVSGVDVCLGGPFGFSCTDTNASGVFTFSELNDGFYHLDIPPLMSGTVTGGPFFRDIEVRGGNVTGVNFGLKEASAQDVLDVYVSGGASLANTRLDVFAFSTVGAMPTPGDEPMKGAGGFVVRELTLDGSGTGSVALPLMEGRWQVGVGPWMPKEPGMMAVPDFTFMPPQPRDVKVETSGVPDLCTSGAGAGSAELCFTLTAATKEIKGKVVDGNGSAIANAFVMARPAFMEEEGPGMAGAAQTDSNGNFSVKVLNGTYIVDASMPGMPPAYGIECTVGDNTGASDGNSTADVYCEGTLIVNNVSGFTSSALTASPDANDLVLSVAKGDTSISGRVLDESGNAISFAHVEAMEVNQSGQPIGGWADAPTDSSGNYTLYVRGGSEGSPKLWKVRAFAPGFGELPALTVSVVQGTNQSGKNLQATAEDFVTVEGYVFIDSNANGTPDAGEGVQGAHVGVHGESGGNGTVTGTDGSYSLKVRAGTGYTIEGFVPGQGPTTVLSNQNLSASATGKNLTIARPGTVVVYVCRLDDPDAAPSATNNCSDRTISGAFVDARDTNGRGNGTRSNSTAGQYELIVPAGSYTVRANEPSVGMIGSASATVTGGGTTYVNIAPPAVYAVTGTVSSSDNACVLGSVAALTDETNGRVIIAQVQSDGSWSVNVPNGVYSVMAGKPGCVDGSDPGTVTVSGAAAEAAARTLTRADATITGRVWIDGNSNSTIDSGENVTVPTMIFATSSTGKKVVIGVDTSASGTSVNYTLAVTAGTWTVEARSDGFETAAGTEVTVASSATATQNIRLTAIAGYTRKEPKPFSVTPSRGGIVKNPEISDRFEVNIPAGALGTSSNQGSVLTKETTAVTGSATQSVVGGKGVQVTPKDASGQPIKTLSASEGGSAMITMPYTDDDVEAAGGSEDNIVIGVWSDEKQQWDPLPTTCDTTNNLCTATVSHFSTFAPILATGGGAPATPSFSSVTAASQTQVDLAWTTVSGATGYDIYRSTTSGGTYSRLGSEPTVSSGSTTSYSDTAGLSAGTTYYYKISSLNDSGESAASAASSVTTLSAGGGGVIGGGRTITPVTPAETASTSTDSSIPAESATSTDSTLPVSETPTSTPSALQPVEIPTLPANPTQEDYENLLGALLKQLAYLQAKLGEVQGGTSTGAVAPAAAIPAAGSYKAPLYKRLVNDDVKALQTFLKAQGTDIYPEGLATGYFGALTEKAVGRFQEKHGIAKPGDAGYGYVGPKTRAKINELLGL